MLIFSSDSLTKDAIDATKSIADMLRFEGDVGIAKSITEEYGDNEYMVQYLGCGVYYVVQNLLNYM